MGRTFGGARCVDLHSQAHFPAPCEGSPMIVGSTGRVTAAARVLVVDDEEYIRDLVSALRIAGFQSFTAADGPRARPR